MTLTSTDTKDKVAQAKKIEEAIRERQKAQAEAELDANQPTETPEVQEPTPEPKAVAAESDPPAQEPEQAEQKHDWKERYTNYKTTTDLTIRDLRDNLDRAQHELKQARETNADLESRIANLEEAVKNPQTPVNMQDVVAGAMTEEQRELLGEDAVVAMASGMQALVESTVGPLKEELNTLRTKTERQENREKESQQEDEAKKRADAIQARLDQVMPGWRELDTDAGFKQWLTVVDDASGATRRDVFFAAYRTGDIGRLASFYGDYKRSTEAKANPASNTAPRSNPTDSVPAAKSKRIYTNEGIRKFYEDKRNGVYTQEEADAILRDIAAATTDGRIK